MIYRCEHCGARNHVAPKKMTGKFVAAIVSLAMAGVGGLVVYKQMMARTDHTSSALDGAFPGLGE